MYGTNKKYELSFGIPLHRYFELAAQPLDEQVLPKTLERVLLISREDAHEFIDNVKGIREHYAALQPKSVWEKFGAPGLTGWDYLGPKKYIPDYSGIEVRDLELTNVFFMRDLGLLSTKAARALAEYLKELGISPANLDLASEKVLAEMKPEAIPQVGHITAIEIDNLIRSRGVEPKIDNIEIKFDPERAIRSVQNELLARGFHPKTISALL